MTDRVLLFFDIIAVTAAIIGFIRVLSACSSVAVEGKVIGIDAATTPKRARLFGNGLLICFVSLAWICAGKCA
jgi:hypothetical protein